MSEPQGTILHIDDNEANRYVVRRILQNAGFAVVEASNGTAGLAAVANQPALVILDVQLPDLSGFEVCRQIKSNPETASIPVLHLSASFVKSQDKAEGLDSGADGYLVQPVEPIELLATVRSLLRVRRAEDVALAAAREWQTTFDAMNDSVCLVDRNGDVRRCNQAMSQLFCKPVADLLGCPHAELMHTAWGLGDGACFRRAKATHQRQILEFQAQGQWFAKIMDPVLDEQGTFTGAVFVLIDITDRQRAEAALRESEARFRQMTDAAPMLVWMSGTDQLCYYFNQTWLDFTGRSLEQEMGNGWAEGVHGDDLQPCWDTYSTAFDARRPFEMDYRLRRFDGTYRWILDAGTPRFTPEGVFLGYIGSCVDIHDRKQAQALLQEQNDRLQRLTLSLQEQTEQAQQANRIKDEFLAVLSHELRSPLNPILGWARILQTSQQDEARTQYALETIERNAKLQAQLIEDLLDVSRILQGKLSLNRGQIGLSFTIKAALETVRLAAEAKAIHIQTILEPNVGLVLGDSSRLQQVVWNLLTNAVKFTPQGGHIDVRLEQVNGAGEQGSRGAREQGSRGAGEQGSRGDEAQGSRGAGEQGSGTSDAIAFKALDPTPTPPPPHTPTPPHSTAYAQITVSDTGKGIAPSFIPYVFDYFRQADSTTTRSFGGLGLGLAIVHHLVELHGGTVQVSSPGEGWGATFTVRLPVMAPSSLLPAATFSDRSEFNLNGLKVLFVDDDQDSREFIAFLLKQHGANVTEVDSASAALDRLQQAEFDLLISDIGMPTMDGYALVRHIRARSDVHSAMPAIALTAYAGEIDQQQALAAGFQHHLTKPIEPELLMQTIGTLVAKKAIP